MYRTSDPLKFIEEVKKEELLKIYVQSDASSLCSLKLLSNCLSKDYIKHEVIFIDDNIDVKISNRFVYLYHGSLDEEKENEQPSRRRKKSMNYINLEIHNKLINNENRIEFVKEECKCDENNFNCLINMFYLCKSLNYLNEDALWCCLIPFSFYKCHLFLTYEDKKNLEDDDSQSDSFEECELPTDTCNVCLSILSNINFEIKKSENNKQDGLVIAKNLLHPLILFSDIFSSLKHDIHFVIKNKLLYKKRKDIEEMKIKTFLAHKGISIKFAKELYTNLDHNTKKFLLRNFQIGQQYFLIRRKNLVISAVDMAYILNCYLFNYKTTEAYLILNKFNSVKFQIKKEVAILYEVISEIKQSLCNPIKFQGIIIYKMKANGLVQNLDCYTKFIYDLIGIYIRNRHPSSKYIVIIDVKDKNYFITIGKNVNISNLKINGVVQLFKKF